MLAIERRKLIMEALQEEKRVVVSELSKMYDVSEETIRRDLEKLEKEGLVIKTYGGAVVNENTNVELPYVIRKKTNVLRKQRIAELTAAMISDGDRIMLDDSTTAVFIAKKIKNKKNITLITNSVEILLELSDVTGWKIISTGGRLYEGSLSLVGEQCERVLSRYHVDKAIISCKGVDLHKGVWDSNENNALVKRAMADSAGRVILAVDGSKLGCISFAKICDMKDIATVVTDLPPDGEWQRTFERQGIECIYPLNKGRE